MSRIASYTKLEREVAPKFRESMGLAESTADVRKFFVYSMLELVNGVLAGQDGEFDVYYEDIALTPEQAPGYALSPRLAAHTPMAAALRESDLPAILARFAEVAGNTFRYLQKKPEKTESKIYHGTGRAAR
ncbi:hypothetical protein [Solidesulfovibrio sp.]|uniref:hypothetical protein n=1 Tax=Solidesulfovibrio sp. TaxID=2910990 RepID=UPI002B2089A1|nr:hypothetical protein [Solidesulfovibrio sp.]MEA5090698.1 hypothetical protein [Solidesulfovibrio sp.]HML59958.1 hypothetical protein [Solidesulfovibrio sp.]